MKRTTLPVFVLFSTVLLSAGVPLIAASDEIPRTASGRPDLSGTYDIATLTPLERPSEFGENLYLTPEEARKIEEERQAYVARRSERSDPTRQAPEVGGAPPVGLDDSQRNVSGAGNVGGYNDFWIDAGDSVAMVDGKFRTSIITDPPNGRRPPLSAEARSRFAGRGRGGPRGEESTAYWLDWDGPGPYDGPESRTLSDRCIASFSSAVPALPSLYNNAKRIVQSETHVMILNEMVHEARVVRLDSEHAPAEVRFWAGDSIGWWEGDTLIVETTNFLSSDTLKVIERFSREDADTVHYEFTVEDPSRYASSYTGDFPWPAIDGKVFEYACHEGNYAMGNILRGARLLEREAMEMKAKASGQ